jgi:hypothetical protein
MNTYSLFDRDRSIKHYQNSVFALRAAHNVRRPIRRPRKASAKPASPSADKGEPRPRRSSPRK